MYYRQTEAVSPGLWQSLNNLWTEAQCSSHTWTVLVAHRKAADIKISFRLPAAVATGIGWRETHTYSLMSVTTAEELWCFLMIGWIWYMNIYGPLDWIGGVVEFCTTCILCCDEYYRVVQNDKVYLKWQMKTILKWNFNFKDILHKKLLHLKGLHFWENMKRIFKS